VEYLADVGRHTAPEASSRRHALVAAYEAIGAYERELAGVLIAALNDMPSVKVWGITDPKRSEERAPTVSFTHERLSPRQVATALGERGIFVWDGNYYALPLTEALGVEPDGMVRVGLLHYNTADEVRRLVAALGEL
jgi:selenocysteine lyase/cysteine desulfurase